MAVVHTPTSYGHVPHGDLFLLGNVPHMKTTDGLAVTLADIGQHVGQPGHDFSPQGIPVDRQTRVVAVST